MKETSVLVKNLYRKCALASMAALASGMFGQIVSSMLVGLWLDSTSLSVIGLAMPIYYVYATIGELIGVGGTAVCTKYIGENKPGECYRAFTIVYILNLIICAIVSAILLIFLEPIIYFLGATSEIYQLVRDYCVVLIIGGVFITSIYPAYNFLRLDGKSSKSIIVFLTMGISNILLDILFLKVFHLGVVSVGIATVFGHGAAGIFGAVVLFTKSDNFKLSLKRSTKKGESEKSSKIVGRIVAIGSPSAIGSLCLLIRTLFINNLLVGFGIGAVSAYKVIDSVNSAATIVISGLAGGMFPFIGVYATERDSASIRQVLKKGFTYGMITISAFSLICITFNTQIARLFGENTAGSVTPVAISVFAISLIPSLVNMILVNSYQAQGHAVLANIQVVLRALAIVIIMAPLLSNRLGVQGIWHSFWVAEVVTLILIVGATFFIRIGKKNIQPVFLIDNKAELDGEYQTYSLQSLQEEKGKLQKIVESYKKQEISEHFLKRIVNAVEEISAVIFQKSNPNHMTVRFWVSNQEAVLRFCNDGSIFDPREVKSNLGMEETISLAKKTDFGNTFGANNTTFFFEENIIEIPEKLNQPAEVKVVKRYDMVSPKERESKKSRYQYLLQYHIIFVCKYRMKLLAVEEMAEDMKQFSMEVCRKHKVSIKHMETDQDHIHYVIETEPAMPISEIVDLMKEYTTYHIWKRNFDYLRDYFWKEDTFWEDGYFACSVGEFSEEMIKEYIENQG